MKYCPHCHTTFDDDFVFCLTDGNALIDDSVEQETVVIRKLGFTIHASTDDLSEFCPVCGNSNKVHSRFCKKCGEAIASNSPFPASAVLGLPDAGAVPGSYGETIMFTPPITNASSGAQSFAPSYRHIAFAAFGSLAILILGGVIYSVMISEPVDAGSNTNTNVNRSPSNAVGKVDIAIRDSFDRAYTGDAGGARLTMALKKNGHNLSGRADTDLTWDNLSGSIESDGSFHLNGYERGGPMTGIWSGRIYEDGTITGNWTRPDGAKPRPFSLTQEKN